MMDDVMCKVLFSLTGQKLTRKMSMKTKKGSKGRNLKFVLKNSLRTSCGRVKPKLLECHSAGAVYSCPAPPEYYSMHSTLKDCTSLRNDDDDTFDKLSGRYTPDGSSPRVRLWKPNENIVKEAVCYINSSAFLHHSDLTYEPLDWTTLLPNSEMIQSKPSTILNNHIGPTPNCSISSVPRFATFADEDSDLGRTNSCENDRLILASDYIHAFSSIHKQDVSEVFNFEKSTGKMKNLSLPFIDHDTTVDSNNEIASFSEHDEHKMGWYFAFVFSNVILPRSRRYVRKKQGQRVAQFMRST